MAFTDKFFCISPALQFILMFIAHISVHILHLPRPPEIISFMTDRMQRHKCNVDSVEVDKTNLF